ncbi:MAG: hypothetical protein E5Y10_24925 [Mesorhizobium sp.]|uniref:hypothetical protein n=1 Tax=Mesorhizobium sp. TaxID=1871066 RepID=UPI00121214AC|nr:hypothetical protein [Mesorhizobium sp.]TIN38828.1 MAG: hypothetical protein E5Y13_15350 [Mesorhizobium sp.]TJU85666.1 MAG: hypothetical protein E5Y10_24925 [Mesorhizobium sp.]
MMMPQTDLEPDVAVQAAAEWLAAGRGRTGRAIVPEMKIRFGITTPQACEAIRMAQQLRRRGANATG